MDRQPLAAAVDALNEGDLDPFVALMDDGMVWSGQTRGLPWRRYTPG